MTSNRVTTFGDRIDGVEIAFCEKSPAGLGEVAGQASNFYVGISTFQHRQEFSMRLRTKLFATPGDGKTNFIPGVFDTDTGKMKTKK